MRRWCDSSAICTFSTTVSDAKVAAIWKVRPTPRRQMSRGRMPTSSWPSSLTEPVVAGSCPPTMLKVVDLPAPLGPINASSSPAARSKLMSSTARTPPNALLRFLTCNRLMPASPAVRR
ncbi:Uncharacterised protein [Bordetella pertussis]|nr:Uncharacterised protein [Bordetella pertussis]SUV88359.1 Uncharacterised protein [Bordetella pertussis]